MDILFVLFAIQGVTLYLLREQFQKSNELQNEIDYADRRHDKLVNSLAEYDIEVSRFF